MCSGPPVAPGEPGLITTAVFLLCLPAVPKNNTTPQLWLRAGIYCIYFPKRKEAKVEEKAAVVQHIGNIKQDNESAFMKQKNKEWFMSVWSKRVSSGMIMLHENWREGVKGRSVDSRE